MMSAKSSTSTVAGKMHQEQYDQEASLHPVHTCDSDTQYTKANTSFHAESAVVSAAVASGAKPGRSTGGEGCSGRRYLLWEVPPNTDGQGLSDRRACQAVVLAEALLLGRVAVLPRFTLDSERHNFGHVRAPTDLSEYLSISPGVVETATEAEVRWPKDPSEVVRVSGPLETSAWRDCPATVLVRTCPARGFWGNPVCEVVTHLAGELHGTGRKPTTGLFLPSEQVSDVVAQRGASMYQEQRRVASVQIRSFRISRNANMQSSFLLPAAQAALVFLF